jgi:hypothetical protein
MKKKIFNFGLPRTGTTSFHNFMQNNGYKSVHTNDGFINEVFPEHYFDYISDKNLEKNIIERFIDSYDVFSDLPWYSIKLRDKIIEKYKNDPNVIFVATIRDKTKWIESIKKIIPCIKSDSEIKFHDYEYNQILKKNVTDIELSNYYDDFYASLDNCVVKLSLEDTDEIKFILSEILKDTKINNMKYPHLN